MNHHSTSDPHRYSSPVTCYPPPSPATIITYYLLMRITDLEGKYKPEVETLLLTSSVTNLKVANEHARTLTASRTHEKMDITVIVHYKRKVLGQKAAAVDTTGGETTPSGGDSESPDEIE